MKDLVKRLEIGIEELVLALLIIIEILDFFTLLPAPLEYAEKVVAILAMCYLFYKASITKIVFGMREKHYDLLIVLSFLLISMKTVMGFLISAAKEESIMTGFYSILLNNIGIIEKTGFWMGGIILIVLSMLLVKEKVRKQCLMRIIHEAKPAERAWQKIVRFFSTYLVFMAIFVVVFTPIIEWIGLTVDAPILVILLFFYLFVIVKRGKNMETESFLWKVSESSESFYSKCISMFHSRKTIMTAITGLLVLHLLVDIGHFIIPYTTGLLYPWYFEQLGPGHAPLSALMANDFAIVQTWLAQIGVMLIYILNVLAVLMLFFGPAYAWSYFYKKKKVELPNILWLFFGSMAVFVMEPVFRMGPLRSKALLGTDITTQSIPYISNIGLVLLVAGLVAAIFYILSKKNFGKTAKLGFLVVFIYFGMYLYYFFTDLASFYVEAVNVMFRSGQWFIALHLLIFFAVTIMFYIIGYVLFLYEMYHHKNPQKTPPNT
jgi:hypothetical protein